ncbi:MAG TPA: DNA-processing protein DprA [bacterium]|nr:DNA-processing protein DprA [bacterium]
MVSLSANTQTILLLTSPLHLGRSGQQAAILTPGEYKKLARFLRQEGLQPADLLTEELHALSDKLESIVNPERLQSLLGRGFQLSQAVEHWQSRAIWVLSRADAEYPKVLKVRLKEDSPAVLYGCGNKNLLDSGGLAVVGSRHVDDSLIEYTENIGRLAARSSLTIISGGARGIDQAAMRGALENGGRVIGVLADSLKRAALNRENRSYLMEERLVLISPYDPAAGFHVGTAMQRNKLIYAFADAALVVSSDFQKGGTWTGAIEQLEKLHLTTLYVRSGSDTGQGLNALRQKGALPWPEPITPEELQELVSLQRAPAQILDNQPELALGVHEELIPEYKTALQNQTIVSSAVKQIPSGSTTGEDEQYQLVRSKVAELVIPKTAAEIALELQLSPKEISKWLDRLVKEKVLVKKGKPAKYFPPEAEFPLEF